MYASSGLGPAAAGGLAMGRPKKQNREPFWRSDRSCYYVQHGTRQLRLSPDRDEAWRLWHEFMARPPEPRARHVAHGADTQAIEILDAYLDWCQKHKAARTYAWYRENIQIFSDALPDGLKVTDLKPYHLTRAMDGYAHWANNTKHDFISAVKRAFSWAEAEGLIEKNPLAHVKKPAREAREMAVSPAEYARVIGTVKEPCFRDLLELSWETGARVQELRKIEARFLDLPTGRVVFPPKQAKGKKYHRVIYLTDRAKEILARLAEDHPTGPLLLNSEGNAWTKDAINCAFCRLQLALGRRAITEQSLGGTKPTRFRKTGVEPERLAEAREVHRASVKAWQKDQHRLAREVGTKYHLGAFRKGFATEALKAGVDTVTVAHLLGHRDPSMVSRVYGHVQQDPEHMAAAVRRAKGVRRVKS
jgi:integrase